MTYKYNIGDKVRIKRDLKVGNEPCVTNSMLRYKNELAVITGKSSLNSTRPAYELDIDKGYYVWDEEVLVIPRNTGTTESQTGVSLDTSDLLEQMKTMTEVIKSMNTTSKHSELESAIIEGVIEKSKELATKDLEKDLKERLEGFIRHTYGLLPRQIIEVRKGDKKTRVNGVFHKQFEDILTMVQCGLSPWIAGGAGSGKTHLCEQVAQALDFNCFFTGAVTQEYKLFGYKDANGTYHPTQFYKWCTTPNSLFYFDEIDSSLADVLTTINSALANGYVDFPVGRVDIPKENVFIASANTKGTGADSMYVSRNQLDSATLDRFTYIEFEYDENIEKSLAYDNDLYEFIYKLRKAIDKCGLNELVSMRATKNATALLEQSDMPKEKILKYTIVKTMDKDTINTLVNNIDIDHNNEWFKEFKKLSDM